MELICPFCKKKVNSEHEAVMGCDSCAKDWAVNEEVDHPVG